MGRHLATFCTWTEEACGATVHRAAESQLSGLSRMERHLTISIQSYTKFLSSFIASPFLSLLARGSLRFI